MRRGGARRAALAAVAAAALAIGLGLGVAACGGGKAPAGDQHAWPDPPTDAITKTTESGPVEATVSVWPPKPALGDPMYLRLRVEAKPGVAVDVPFERDAFGRFTVSDWDTQHAHGPDGGAIEVRTYALDAPSSGRHRLPPLRLTFTDGRAAGDAGASGTTHELLTDEIPIQVAPVSANMTAADLRPARGPLDPVVGRAARWPWIVGGAGGLVVLVVLILAARAVRRRRFVRAQVSAYEAALAALAALEHRGAPGADDADAWFVELSAIVRRYLEGRFRVRAPELTTEEFLQEVRQSPDLDRDHRARLGEFLEQCDRVKFAGYRPDPDESLAALAAARAFVEETRAAAATDHPSPPPAASVVHEAA